MTPYAFDTQGRESGRKEAMYPMDPDEVIYRLNAGADSQLSWHLRDIACFVVAELDADQMLPSDGPEALVVDADGRAKWRDLTADENAELARHIESVRKLETELETEVMGAA